MSLEDVLKFLNFCEDHNIVVWVDGGWGVDALLGKQTREHEDLDIAIRARDSKKLTKLLTDLGYELIRKDDTTEYGFAMGNSDGHEIDIHAFELNGDGSNKNGIAYIEEH